MSSLMELYQSTDKRSMSTLSGPDILLRSGLEVESSGTQAFSAAQFENLAKDIDEELSSVRVDYEKRLLSVVEEKVDVERRYAMLLDWQKWEAGGTLDSQTEHARHCEIALSGDAGIALILDLYEHRGCMDKTNVLQRMASSFSFLATIVHLGAAEIIIISDSNIILTDSGRKLAARLTELSE
jgi:hypothetical protein